MSHQSLSDLPYEERRIIIVADKVPSSTKSTWDNVMAGFLMGINPGGALAQSAFEAVKVFKNDGETIVPIDWDAARSLRFPPGHPRRSVVYVGHPVDPGSYIPAADFHRFLFEHKVAEAIRLIRSLGARTVTITRIDGWDREAAATLGLGLPFAAAGADIDAGGEITSREHIGRQVLTSMKLTPIDKPHIPENLVWTPHEPLWMEVAGARIESGLDEFIIDVRSMDDFGVNAHLKALINKTGLEVGGKFVEHENTLWRLEGRFV